MHVIASIQYLRALAALMVVFGHAQHDARVWSAKLDLPFAASHLLPWGAGVDLFFVISGFIMVYASRPLFGAAGGVAKFMRRRLTRIVPLWWIMATIYLVLMLLQRQSAGMPIPSWANVLAAYLFLPVDTFGSGLTLPFYTLGWTLNYEMMFYAMFAVFIALPMGIAIPALAATLLLLVTMGTIAPFENVALAFWTQPIILEFVAGMLIAAAVLAGYRLTKGWRGGLALAGLALLHFDMLNASQRALDWTTPNDWWRVFAWGVPAALILLSATGGGAQPPAGKAQRLGILAGNASYALYLSHPFVIVLARKALIHFGIFDGWMLVAASVAASLAVALAVYALLEKPLTRWLNNRFEPPRAPAITPVSPAPGMRPAATSRAL